MIRVLYYQVYIMRNSQTPNLSNNPFAHDWDESYQSDQQILAQLREYNDTVNDLIIRERNGEIKQLETDLELIAEIQQDLALMVYAQGESLDIAVDNVEKAEITIKEATEHIKQAAIIKKKTNKLFIGGLLTATGFAIGGGLLAIASPLTGALIAGGGIVSGVVMIVVKVVK